MVEMGLFKKKYCSGIAIGIASICVVLILLLIEFSIENPKTYRSLSSNELIELIYSDQTESAQQFIEKTIEVKGVVKQVRFKNNSYSLLLSGGHAAFFVLCEMQGNQNELIKKISEGETVKIKGVYKGYLIDAILLNCTLLEKSENE